MQQESQKEQRVLKVSMFSALVLATLSLLLCITPVRICVENFKDLLMVAPKEIDEKLTAIMENLSCAMALATMTPTQRNLGDFI